MSQKYTRAFQQTKMTGREMRDSWQTHAHTLRGRALWVRTGEVVRKHPVHRDSSDSPNKQCLLLVNPSFPRLRLPTPPPLSPPLPTKHPSSKQPDGFKTAVVKNPRIPTLKIVLWCLLAQFFILPKLELGANYARFSREPTTRRPTAAAGLRGNVDIG